MAKSIPISDSFDLGTVFTHKLQRRDKAKSSLKLVYGLDSETWKGNIFLLADSDGRFTDDISPESVIEFLFHKKYQNSWNFFFNLKYDAEVILKLLDDLLYSYKRTRHFQFKFKNYSITYIEDKVLRITKGHHSVSYYDIKQFYQGGIVTAYENNIGQVEDSYKSMKEKRDQFSPSYYSHHRNQVRQYCVIDCVLTKKLSEHWIRNYYKAFGFYCNKWISSGYLAEKVLINHGIEIPKFDLIPYDVQKMAWSVVDHGGRIEILRRGFIGTSHLYDINSAYPYAFSTIPDITKGRWIRSNKVLKNAKLGFFHILADIPDGKTIAPFPFKKGFRIFFPTGKFETTVTLHELQACENPSFYEILDSYQFIPASDSYPYKDFIEKLYLKRQELKRKGDPLQLPIKIILNSIYGKTGQIRNGIGNLFNPVIFVSITGMIRGLLYKFVIENNLEKDLVFFATDAVMTRKKLDLDSNLLGKFSSEKIARDTFVLQNGYYKRNGLWKNRGIATIGPKTFEHMDTIQKDGKLFLKLKELRNTRLKSGILFNRLEDVGNLQYKIRWIDPNADKKRQWFGRIESIDDKTENVSVPISMNY